MHFIHSESANRGSSIRTEQRVVYSFFYPPLVLLGDHGSNLLGEFGRELWLCLRQLLPGGTLEDGLPFADDELDAGLKGAKG